MMPYRDFKHLTRRTASDEILRNTNIAKNPKCDWYQHGLASMVYNFFDKNSTGTFAHTGRGIIFENN